MNKQAILITAYKDLYSLRQLITLFGNNFNFYIHIDKKSKIDTDILKQFDNVFVSKKYEVNWGGFNHLKAILFLSKIALENNENSFFHLITGEDFPVKSIEEFLILDQSKNYLDYFEVTGESGKVWFDRLSSFHLYDFFNAKIEKQKYYIDILVRLQRKYKIKRSYPDDFPKKIYAGSTYWSLNRDALEYVINYPDKSFLNRFRYTFCAEEFYFQTLLLNSHWYDTIVKNNLRYYDWDSGRGGYPAFLDETDFDKLIALKDCFFARKIKSDSVLKEMLVKYISSNSHNNI
ncbi:Core-2/I-Branching enzyme [Epilithonimonas bovis DSM 19482]|uniref:Peptide O-xylosyltransferase n=1 Tax=Epilithonimonas bovis DSM 19482 TaxID=1121284 RepID=A0A1U7PWW7_9FLAO|nr:beta-1,6-N-acetylglucosaminyltransferase [Epilithonimonas bovis]SIT97389.1 Core-2/I-Branching enzyme [Epilithonimonas bovis DSM 19482]